MTYQKVFRDGVKNALEESDFTSCRQLSFAAKGSEPQVQKIVKGFFDESANGPGVFFVYRISRALGVTIDSLFGELETPTDVDISTFNNWPYSSEVNFNSFIDAHARGAGRLEALDALSDFFDLYAIPLDGAHTPIIKRVGVNSLFGMRLKSTSTIQAQRELNGLSPRVRRNILKIHSEANDRGVICDTFSLDHKMITTPAHVRATYSRLCLAVEGPSGEPLIAVYCQPIPV